MANPNSQYDPGLIAKEVHDFHGQSIRTSDTRTVVDKHFTHFRATYNDDSKPIVISYFRGTKSHSTNFEATGPANLSGAHFSIRSSPDNSLWVVWFNVDNLSTQPIVADAKDYIQIDISSTDNNYLVALSIVLTLNTLHKDKFKCSRNCALVEIVTTGLGLVDNSDAATSGFVFTQSPGRQELASKVSISYSGSDPYFEGQLLKGYEFDLFSAKFKLKSASSIGNAYLFQDFDDQGAVMYEGTESKDGKYLIKRITQTGSLIEIRFANISNNPLSTSYSTAWGNRASLSFSQLSILRDL